MAKGATRRTGQKSAIRSVLEGADRPLTPLEILALAQEEVSSLGIATVYRNLKSLVEDGSILEVVLPGESARLYERGDHHHHHHFLCRACGRVFDIHACPQNVEGLAPPGFVVDDHELVIYGRCADCGAPAPEESPE
jgi:Fur family ferric uptake transcriptional regulator